MSVHRGDDATFNVVARRGYPSGFFVALLNHFRFRAVLMDRPAGIGGAGDEDDTVRASLTILGLIAGLLAGCDRAAEGPTVTGPAFDPVAFFDGHTHSRGVIESRSGAPTEWIVTDSRGERDGSGGLRMVQHLSFQDGTTQQRDWVLWPNGPGRFDATANDMIGTAKGFANGGMFHWQWVLARSPGNRLMDVTMNQWMYPMDDGSVMIRTTVSKFGMIVAEVTEQFTHPAGA